MGRKINGKRKERGRKERKNSEGKWKRKELRMERKEENGKERKRV